MSHVDGAIILNDSYIARTVWVHKIYTPPIFRVLSEIMHTRDKIRFL